MSCPKCSDKDIDQDGTTWFFMGSYEISHCPSCGVNLAAPPLTWTQEKPTQQGFYWAIHVEMCDEGDDVVLTQDHIELITVFRDKDGELRVDEDDEHLGSWHWFYGPLPIEKPEPPKED